MKRFNLVLVQLVCILFILTGVIGCRSSMNFQKSSGLSQNEIMQFFERKKDPYGEVFFPDFVWVENDSACSNDNLMRYFGATCPGGVSAYWNISFPGQKYNWYAKIDSEFCIAFPITPEEFAMTFRTVSQGYYFVYKIGDVFYREDVDTAPIVKLDRPTEHFEWERLNPFAFRFRFRNNLDSKSIKMWYVELLGRDTDPPPYVEDDLTQGPIFPKYCLVFVQWNKTSFNPDTLSDLAENFEKEIKHMRRAEMR